MSDNLYTIGEGKSISKMTKIIKQYEYMNKRKDLTSILKRLHLFVWFISVKRNEIFKELPSKKNSKLRTFVFHQVERNIFSLRKEIDNNRPTVTRARYMGQNNPHITFNTLDGKILLS